MQRLILPEPRSERGASAVIVAVSMVALLGFAALSIDVGALWSDKKELQNGADAAALAVAQKCANDGCDFDYDTMADDYAAENKSDANARAISVEINQTAGTVLVTTTSTRNLWFAPVLNIDTADVGARAAASWTTNPSEMTTIPLTVSQCQFAWQNGLLAATETTWGPPLPGDPVKIMLKSTLDKIGEVDGDNALYPCADNPAHNELPGGFGWLTPTGVCETLTHAGDWVPGDTGTSAPCSRDELEQILGTTPGNIVKLPLFSQTNELPGSNSEYRITGYAALEIQGYCFVAPGGSNPRMNSSGCGGSNQHITAKFVSFSTLDDSTGGGGTNYGVVSVRLTE